MSKQLPKKLSVKYSHGELTKQMLLQKLLLFLGTKLSFRIPPGKNLSIEEEVLSITLLRLSFKTCRRQNVMGNFKTGGVINVLDKR